MPHTSLCIAVFTKDSFELTSNHNAKHRNTLVCCCVYECLVSAGNNAVLSSTFEGLSVYAVSISAVLFSQEVIDKENIIILRGC